MSSESFWAASWAEIAAYRRVFDADRTFTLTLYARQQAAFHNAHFSRSDKKHWTDADFLPDSMVRKPATDPDAKPDWLVERESLERQLGVVGQTFSPESAVIHAELVDRFSDRQKRAQEARARGASREEILHIMEGA